MKINSYLLGCFFVFTGCQSHYDGTVVEIDVDSAEDVFFEDVAKDIKIIPLISDIPLEQIAEIECYGNESIIRPNGRNKIYYFVDGVLTSTLNSSGRGRGEYIKIQQFVYSPKTKVLSVLSQGENKILKYSVPKMTFIGSYPIDGSPRYLSEHDDSTLLVRMRYPAGGYGIRLINTNDGHCLKTIKDIGGYSLMFDEHVGYYRQNNRVFSVVGNISFISSLDKSGNEEIEVAYSFKDKDMPKKMAEFDFENMNELLKFTTFSMTNDIYTGGVLCQKVDNSISFWYHREMSDDKNDRHYINIKKGVIEKQYKGFKVKGLTIPIIADCLDGKGGFTTIIQSLPENIEDNDVEPSELATEILNAMKKQSDNNPILINYRIQ